MKLSDFNHIQRYFSVVPFLIMSIFLLSIFLLSIFLGSNLYADFHRPDVMTDLRSFSDKPVVAVLKTPGWSGYSQARTLKIVSKQHGLQGVDFVLIEPEYLHADELDLLTVHKAVLIEDGTVRSEFSSRFMPRELARWLSDTLYSDLTMLFDSSQYHRLSADHSFVMIYFSAQYGPTAGTINPVLVALKSDPATSEALPVLALDYDEEMAWRRHFGVTTPDTLVLVRDGKVVKRWPMETSSKKVIRFIEKRRQGMEEA